MEANEKKTTKKMKNTHHKIEYLKWTTLVQECKVHTIVASTQRGWMHKKGIFACLPEFLCYIYIIIIIIAIILQQKYYNL